VGDIAYPSHARMNKRLTHGNIRVADPLWHHVTNEPDELSFHVGDVIMVSRNPPIHPDVAVNTQSMCVGTQSMCLLQVLDISDKDWWWGRKTGSPSSTSLAESEATEQLSGWFPSTFVRVSQVLSYFWQNTSLIRIYLLLGATTAPVPKLSNENAALVRIAIGC